MSDDIDTTAAPSPAVARPIAALLAPSPAAIEAGPTPAAPTPPAPTPAAATGLDKWREIAAGPAPGETATPEEKDAHGKMLRLLERYNSLPDAAKALRAAQVKISDGTLKTALPKNATEDQLKTWRSENGIPEAPDKYDLTGVQMSEGDKTLAAAWIKDMHGVNATPEQVKAGLASWQKVRQAQTEEQEQRTRTAQAETEDALRAAWGTDYRSNKQGIETMLTQAPESVMQGLLTARMPDGVHLLHNKEVVDWLAGQARELGFVGATLDLPNGDLGKGLDDEISKMEKLIQDDRKTYDSNPRNSTRYMELLAARERRKK